MGVCGCGVGSVGSAVTSLQSTQPGWKKQRSVSNGCDGVSDECKSLSSLTLSNQQSISNGVLQDQIVYYLPKIEQF